MKKWKVVTLAAGLAIPAIGLGGMMMEQGDMSGGCMMNMSMARHHYVMRKGIGDDYAGASNPLAETQAEIQQGRLLYERHCATCHGESGRGDGPAGKQLRPRPANIARFAKMPMASDGYLLWTISEGGEPVGSAMPPMKDVLSSEEIWKVIAYLREMSPLR